MNHKSRLSRLVFGAAACWLLALSCGRDPVHRPPDLALTTQAQLRADMRRLWVDHVTWTRVYLMSSIANLPDASAAARRLLKNQDDLGDAFVPYYSAATGEALKVLLRQHINLAVELIDAAKANDPQRLEGARARWVDNADQLAAFLAAANPHWNLADLRSLMRTHLETTLAEATARIRQDFEGEVRAYDAVVAHIVVMADALADGIAVQFPLKVRPSPKSARDEALDKTMRSLWTDHVAWTRFYLISAIADLPDAPAQGARLLRNQVELGDAIKPFYGAVAGDGLTLLLTEHIIGAVEIVAAARARDPDAQEQAVARWYANADQIAAYLAAVNPSWAEADLKQLMRTHLDQTVVEAVARLQGDFAGDVRAYDEIVQHILQLAETISTGVALQFPEAG